MAEIDPKVIGPNVQCASAQILHSADHLRRYVT
jgi:hypothetical protein